MSDGLKGAEILITGGAGFVGSNLVRRCLKEGAARVVAVDNLLSSERDNLPADPRVELWTGSIADDDLLAGIEDRFPYIFHLSTYHGNQSSIADPLADHRNNLLTTLKLYERLKGFKKTLRRVVYVSTGCALAEKDVLEAEAVVEDGPVPLDYDSPYQISKVVGEMYSLYFHRSQKIPIVRARFQNVYGPGEALGAGRWRGTPATVWRNVTPTFVYRALKKMQLQVNGSKETGGGGRDFIFVGDIVEGLVRCATTPGMEGDVFNLASGVEHSIGAWAEMINRLAGNPVPVEYIPPRSWDRSLKRYGSPTKAKEKLGFAAAMQAEQGLTETINWTRENLARIDGLIAKHADKMKQAGA